MGDWVSLYNTAMKLFFIGSSVYILWLMKQKFRSVTFAAARVVESNGMLTASTCRQRKLRPHARYLSRRILGWTVYTPWSRGQLPVHLRRGSVVFLHLARERRHFPPTFHAPTDW